MRRWVVIALAGLWGGLGCHRASSSGEAAPAAKGPTVDDGGDPSTLQTSEPQGPPYAVTSKKLEGFARYQRRMSTVYQGMMDDLDRVSTLSAKLGLLDGGSFGGTDGGDPALWEKVESSMKILKARSAAEKSARDENGLTEDDVRHLEELVSAVLSRRSLLRDLQASDAIAHWDALKQKLPASQRMELEETIEQMRREQESAVKLLEERRRFGDRNVDLVLEHEAELAAGWKAWRSALAGERAKDR